MLSIQLSKKLSSNKDKLINLCKIKIDNLSIKEKADIITKVSELIKKGIDISFEKELPLLTAISSGNLNLVILLVENKVNIKSVLKQALNIAVEYNRGNVVEWLVNKYKYEKKILSKSLYDAVNKRFSSTVKALIDVIDDDVISKFSLYGDNEVEQYVNILLVKEDKLVDLCKTKNVNLEEKKIILQEVDELIKQGVKISYKKELPLLMSILNNNLDLAKLLIANGANIKSIALYSLNVAVASGYENVVEWLLDEYEYESEDLDKNLLEAADKNYPSIVKKLIEAGAENDQIMGIFCEYNNIDMVKFLIEHNIGVNGYSNEPIIHACAYGYIEIVEMLIDNGANINFTEGYPIAIASQYGNLNVIKMLIDNGANPDHFGNAMEIARHHNYDNVVEYFRSIFPPDQEIQPLKF